MKIAFFHNLPSGGALKMLSHTAQLFRARGHVVSLYSFSTAEHDFAPWPSKEIRLIEKLCFTGWLKFQAYQDASRKLAESINQSDADFVWVDKCRFLSAPLVLKYIQKPYLFYAHEPLRNFENERLAGSIPAVGFNPANPIELLAKISSAYDHFRVKFEDKKSIRSASGKILTNSKYTAAWIERVYDVQAKVLYPSVNTDFFMPDGNVEKKRQVVSVGRLDAMKGYDFLLSVLLAMAPSVRPEWHIVCDYIDERFYKQFQKKAALGNVCFKIHHRISEEKLREIYRDSLWTLCASVHEPFGLVPLESMACGTPVLAVREGGFIESVKDGEVGYLLPREVLVWAQKIEQLLSDMNHSVKLGGNGVEYTRKNWSSKDWCDRLAQVSGVPF